MSSLLTLSVPSAEMDADYWRPGIAEVSLATLEQPDGDPIIGIQYRTDYRAEEEWGVGHLRTALTTADPFQFAVDEDTRVHIGVFTDVNGFVLSTMPLPKQEFTWGEVLVSKYGFDAAPEYAQDWDQRVKRTSQSKVWDLRWKNIAKLRAAAKGLGISPMPRKKADLLAAIAAHPDFMVEVKTWPAWFHSGEVLVVRADSGPVGQAVAHVRQAVIEGTLAVGDASGPFSTGMFLYNAADETEALKVMRAESIQWHLDRMAEAEPTHMALKDAGWSVWSLAGPRDGFQSRIVREDDLLQVPAETDPDAVYYWLNASPPRTFGRGPQHKQVSGWYTLDEIGQLLRVHAEA